MSKWLCEAGCAMTRISAFARDGTGEIVGAGHASATGRFDDDQLFYLMSRGIPSTEARRLVLRGFFAELLRNIKIDTIEERLMARIDRELSQVHV